MRPSDSVSSKSGGCAARPLERLASALLAAAALSAPCADALAEDVASNAFVVVRADGVRSAGETGFHTPCSSGAGIEVEPREGWKLGGNSSVGDDPGRKFISVVSSLNEDSQQIWFDVCSFSYSMETNHAPVPAIRAVTQPKQIALYAVPEGNVRVSAAASVEIVSNGVHDVVRRWHACEGCGGPHDPGEELVFSEESPLKYFDWTSSGPGCTTNSNTWTGMLTKGLEQNLSFNIVASNDCRECTCGASTNAVVDVYELSEERDDYLGLDRTDYGRTNAVVKTARAILDPGAAGEATYDWKDCGICAFTGRTDLATADYFAPDLDAASESFLAEKLTVTAGVTEDGVDASATCTTNFTVVKVDVEIDGMGEEFEETAGVYVQQVPDTDTERWKTEWTNSLKDVTITCKPDDGPIADQWVTLEFPDESLWVRSSKGGYEKAKKRYRVKDLNRTHFKLHGHERSAKFKGDSIVAKHEVSKAVDKALFTVFGRPWLVPDYDRKNGIDDNDVAKAKEGETVFRFWINDDDDRDGIILQPDGKIQSWQLHKSKSGGNCENKTVDGLSDLVDMTPLWLDISGVLPNEAEQIVTNVEWFLESDCYNAVWTFQDRRGAHNFRDTSLTTCGPDFDKSLHEAPVCRLSGRNGKVPERLLRQMLESKGKSDSRGVIMLEGCRAGTRLELVAREISSGRLVSKGSLRTKVSPVTDMIRWINLRTVADMSGDMGMHSNYAKEPDNRPDSECVVYDNRHFLFVHGYNINKDEALGWSCEVFKRLWQSGYRGRFSGIDWYGDETQIDLGVTTFCPNYWGNVVHAFDTAHALKQAYDQLGGEKVVMAHSLGNMLVCSAIADEGMTDNLSCYYMMNAAVPTQALTGSEECESVMIPVEWSKVDPAFMSAYWYKLFTENDFRSRLNWAGRFKSLPEQVRVVNLYSSTENVVRDNASLPAWKWQETWKGGIINSLLGGEAGWSQNSYHSQFWEDLFSYDENAMLERSRRMTEAQKIVEPLFSKFKSCGDDFHSLIPYSVVTESEEKHLRAQLLGYCIPATSLCIGANSFLRDVDITSHEYSEFKSGTNGWPRNNDEWHHSDFVVVAYYYITRLYDKLQEGL